MKRTLTLLGALLVLAHPAAGQDTTATVLRRAREFYEALNVERALPLLRQLLSPQWPFDVTPRQRAEAYKYLGAASVLVGQRDSAELQFQAALARDPFTGLDPLEFTPAQIAAFDAARRRSFAVATRPVTRARVDVRIERIAFTIVTIHAATLTALIRPADTTEGFRIFTGDNEGVREIHWDGLTPGGSLASPGRYELLIIGRSRLLSRTDSTRSFFDLAHEVQPLEDTIAAIPTEALLPEREPTVGLVAELAKGLGVAAGVVLLSEGLGHSELGRGQRGAVVIVAGAGVVVGVVSLLSRARGREIPANIEANRRQHAARRAANEAIRRRNADKFAHPLLVITPAAGIAR